MYYIRSSSKTHKHWIFSAFFTVLRHIRDAFFWGKPQAPHSFAERIKMLKTLLQLFLNKLQKRKVFIMVLAYPDDPKLDKDWRGLSIEDAINSNRSTIFIQAPMKRKDREMAYKRLKDYTEDPIGILYFECNYDEYTELHPNMTVKERNNAYAELEPPIRGVDCDVYVLADEF